MHIPGNCVCGPGAMNDEGESEEGRPVESGALGLDGPPFPQPPPQLRCLLPGKFKCNLDGSTPPATLLNGGQVSGAV